MLEQALWGWTSGRVFHDHQCPFNVQVVVNEIASRASFDWKCDPIPYDKDNPSGDLAELMVRFRPAYAALHRDLLAKWLAEHKPAPINDGWG